METYIPINNKVFIRSLLITDRTNPRRFFLIHLNIKSCIKTLKVGTGKCPTWNCQPHFPELSKKGKVNVSICYSNLGSANDFLKYNVHVL